MAENETPSLDTLQAQLAAANAELTNAKARITELNGEAKGHRLNSDKHRGEAEAAAKARDEAIAEASRVKAEIESAHAAKIKEVETKAAEATTSAQRRAIRADLKVAAKEAGAQDVNDVLALLDMAKVKANEEGDVENAGELIADMKKSKPWLFGAASSSSTARPPPDNTAPPKKAADMTAAELAALSRSLNIRV